MAKNQSTFFPVFSQLYPSPSPSKRRPTSNDLVVRECVRRRRVEVLMRSREAAEKLMKALPTVVKRRQLSVEAISELIAEAFCSDSEGEGRVA